MDYKTIEVNLDIKQVTSREFEGYGSIFNNVDNGGDVVMEGAFKRSLSEHMRKGTLPMMFWMHRMDQVPGVWKTIKEDSVGLYVKGELVDTQLGNEVRTLLKKKAVRGMSIGYRTLDADYDNDGNRLLKEVDLVEVSIVSLAMNPLATVDAVKSRLSEAGEYIPTEREFEKKLRDAGFSRTVAKRLVAKVFDDNSDSGKLEEPRLRGKRFEGGDVDEVLRALERNASRFISAALPK